MKAMAITEHGAPENLKLMDLPEPVPGEFDLLVETHACGMNPVDFKKRQFSLGGPSEFPLVLGFDVSGVVAGAGSGVEGFTEGDLVYASPSLARNGSNAEYVLVDYRAAAHRPKTLDHRGAAAVPLVTLTAWESLYDRAAVEPRQNVLIHAGGGGVGHVAIQLARLRGSRIITTASSEDSLALCRELGADVVINYKEENVVERVMAETGGKGCDMIFDTVGGPVFEQCFQCLAMNGSIVAITPTQTDKIAEGLFFKNATLHCEFMGVPAIYGINIESHGEILRQAAELIDSQRLKVHIGRTYPLEELAEAHRYQESGHATGKIVITVKD